MSYRAMTSHQISETENAEKVKYSFYPLCSLWLNLPFLILLAVLLLPSISHSKTLVVGVDYPTINAALKKAVDRDVIEVRQGEYREQLSINRTIRIIGINNPVIVGGQERHIIEIQENGVVIEGLTIKNEGLAAEAANAGIYVSGKAKGVIIKNNRLIDMQHGIWVNGAKDVVIESNSIEGRQRLDRNYRGNCINLSNSRNANITGNKLNYCRDGVYIERSPGGRVTGNEMSASRYGIHAMWADNTTFNNNISTNNLMGLAIMYSRQTEIKGNISGGNRTNGLFLVQAAESLITGNVFIGNNKGVFLYNSSYCRLDSNLIINNKTGFHSWGGSEDNSVNENSFIQNETQLKLLSDKWQKWDHNYWSDYPGWDMNGDGIGDLPYESNTIVDRILWRYPAAKLLYSSASLQLLWTLEKQFPSIKKPGVIDIRPSMSPLHKNWREIKERYPYSPGRDDGEGLVTH